MLDDGQQLDMEATPARMQRTRHRKAAMLLLFCGGLPTLATFLGFLGQLWWPFEILSNYRFQYALILVGVVIAAMFTRRVMWMLLLCLPLALNVVMIIPLYIPTPEQEVVLARMAEAAEANPPEPEELDDPNDTGMAQIIRYDDKAKILRNGLMWHVSDEPLTIMNLNMNVAERGSEHVMHLINDGKADIILAQSITESTLKQLSMHGTPYRIHNSLPREDGYGIALLSRVSLPPKIRIIQSQTIDLAPEDQGVPAIAATIQWFDRPIELLMVHLSGPWSPSGAKLYREQMQGIVKWVNEQNHPVIVVGDFNATPWAPNFADMLRKTGLINSQIGFGMQATWPASGGFPLGEIPVDHCLHSEQLVTIERGLGPTNGADHRPLIVKLNWLKPHEMPVSDEIPVVEEPAPVKPEKKNNKPDKVKPKAQATPKDKAKPKVQDKPKAE
jgi:endonuclease/exonuclease/phosphatase (EEP) superfamily protein YafD